MRAYQRSDPLEEHHKLMTDWDIYCSSGGSCRFRQQFPLEILFVVLQWFNWIAENIFSWTFAAGSGHYDKKTAGKSKNHGKLLPQASVDA
ncbi:MAG: hypothetical protein OXD29_06735, partial [Roseovarius sp.]|nr:hypothetical protein [Roseovarius sp.]